MEWVVNEPSSSWASPKRPDPPPAPPAAPETELRRLLPPWPRLRPLPLPPTFHPLPFPEDPIAGGPRGPPAIPAVLVPFLPRDPPPPEPAPEPLHLQYLRHLQQHLQLQRQQQQQQLDQAAGQQEEGRAAALALEPVAVVLEDPHLYHQPPQPREDPAQFRPRNHDRDEDHDDAEDDDDEEEQGQEGHFEAAGYQDAEEDDGSRMSVPERDRLQHMKWTWWHADALLLHLPSEAEATYRTCLMQHQQYFLLHELQQQQQKLLLLRRPSPSDFSQQQQEEEEEQQQQQELPQLPELLSENERRLQQASQVQESKQGQPLGQEHRPLELPHLEAQSRAQRAPADKAVHDQTMRLQQTDQSSSHPRQTDDQDHKNHPLVMQQESLSWAVLGPPRLQRQFEQQQKMRLAALEAASSAENPAALLERLVPLPPRQRYQAYPNPQRPPGVYGPEDMALALAIMQARLDPPQPAPAVAPPPVEAPPPPPPAQEAPLEEAREGMAARSWAVISDAEDSETDPEVHRRPYRGSMGFQHATGGDDDDDDDVGAAQGYSEDDELRSRRIRHHRSSRRSSKQKDRKRAGPSSSPQDHRLDSQYRQGQKSKDSRHCSRHETRGVEVESSSLLRAVSLAKPKPPNMASEARHAAAANIANLLSAKSSRRGSLDSASSASTSASASSSSTARMAGSSREIVAALQPDQGRAAVALKVTSNRSSSLRSGNSTSSSTAAASAVGIRKRKGDSESSDHDGDGVQPLKGCLGCLCYKKPRVPQVITAANGRILKYNPPFLALSGLSPQQMSNVRIFDYLPSKRKRQLYLTLLDRTTIPNGLPAAKVPPQLPSGPVRAPLPIYNPQQQPSGYGHNVPALVQPLGQDSQAHHAGPEGRPPRHVGHLLTTPCARHAPFRPNLPVAWWSSSEINAAAETTNRRGIKRRRSSHGGDDEAGAAVDPIPATMSTIGITILLRADNTLHCIFRRVKANGMSPFK